MSVQFMRMDIQYKSNEIWNIFEDPKKYYQNTKIKPDMSQTEQTVKWNTKISHDPSLIFRSVYLSQHL